MSTVIEKIQYIIICKYFPSDKQFSTITVSISGSVFCIITMITYENRSNKGDENLSNVSSVLVDGLVQYYKLLIGNKTIA